MLAAVLLLTPSMVSAQYDIARLGGVRFSERVESEIVTQSGTAERQRRVVRTAAFRMVVRGDTLVVTTDTVALTESVDGARRAMNVDAVIGARWKLVLTARGTATVVGRPFVPASISDVSDVGTAMDDFFPPAPPKLAMGTAGTDSAGRRWRRSADSSGIERYHFSVTHRGTTRDARDSVTVESSQDATENTDLAWGAQRGPVAWSRSILTALTTRFAGRTVRAQVDQRIVVHRVGW